MSSVSEQMTVMILFLIGLALYLLIGLFIAVGIAVYAKADLKKHPWGWLGMVVIAFGWLPMALLGKGAEMRESITMTTKE